MNTEYIHVEENDGVLFIKMDDPKTRNALGSDMSDEINDQLEDDNYKEEEIIQSLFSEFSQSNDNIDESSNDRESNHLWMHQE